MSPEKKRVMSMNKDNENMSKLLGVASTMTAAQRRQKREEMLSKFRKNVIDRTGKEEYNDLVEKSFKSKENANQLWILLEHFNNKKVQLKSKLEDEKVLKKRSTYV